MTIWEFGESWMNSSLGIFYAILVLRVLSLTATVYFSSSGLLRFRKGWNMDNKKELRIGMSFILCGILFLSSFIRTLFYENI
jgi:hypothetical protein